MNASEVLAALREHYSGYPIVREVVLADQYEAAVRRRDYADRATDPSYWMRYYEKNDIEVADAVPEGWTIEASKPTRRIDGLLYESGRLTAIEIKVTRADFRNDTDEKRRAWMEHSHRFVYATPAGLVSPDEVPEGCGLWEVDPETGVVKARKRAAVRKNPQPLPMQVLGAMFYRVSNYEKASAA